MKKNRINLERVVSIIGFLFLAVAFLGSYVMNGDESSIIPHNRIVLCAVHCLCGIASLVNAFIPRRKTEIFILLAESFFTMLTNYEILAIFFFYNALILVLLNSLFKKRQNAFIIVMFVIHFIDILLIYTHGWARTFIAFFTSLYALSFYTWVYSTLKAKLSCLIPTQITTNSILSNVKPGSKIKLKDYNLSERQINFVLEYTQNGLSYKELSEKYFVSISTVKHEFSEVFKIFNVSKIDELQILLLQYQIS